MTVSPPDEITVIVYPVRAGIPLERKAARVTVPRSSVDYPDFIREVTEGVERAMHNILTGEKR